MDNKKSTLKGKLKSYSAIAGSLVAAVNSADAQVTCVTYTDINPDQVLSTNGATYMVDLNNDGTNEVRLYMQAINSGYWGPNNRARAYPINGLLDYIAGQNAGNYFAAALNFNATIDATLNWLPLSWYPGRLLARTSWNYAYGPWASATDKYMAVKFKLGANIHYGWVRMDCDIGQPNLTVKDYAYDPTPGNTVYAGVVPPCLANIEIPALIYNENDPATSVSTNITLNSAAVPNMDSARVKIITNYMPNEDVLSFTNQNGITGTWNAATGTMILKGSSSAANYQSALRSVQYSNTSNTPSNAVRTVEFKVWETQLTVVVASVALTRNINVVPVNDLPTLANIEVPALVYTENDPATPVTATLTGLDLDNATWDTAVVQIFGNYIASEDVLAFTNQNGIIGNWNPATGTMTLSGSSTVANYEAAMRSITYFNSSQNPSNATRTVTFQAKDTANYGNTVFRQINVVPVNDLPTLANIEANALTYTENDPATPISATITGNDQDDVNWDSAWVQISNNYINGEDVLGFVSQNGITGTWNAANGTMSLVGLSSIANYQAALRAVTYMNTSQQPSVAIRTVTYTVNDGMVNSNTQTRDINVINVNDAPVLANMEVNPIGYIENQFFTQITNNTTVNDLDNTVLSSAWVQITGNYANGEDILGFTNQNGIVGSFNPGTGTMMLTGVATLADYEAAIRSVRYENLSDNPSVLQRTVSITANDGIMNSNTVTRVINITAVNDAPILSLIEIPAVIYNAGDPATQITATLKATDPDDVNLAGGSAQITGNYFIGEDFLAFTNMGGISGNWNAANGILTLTGSAPVATYETALRSITYVNTNPQPQNPLRTVTFQVNDGVLNSFVANRDINVVSTLGVQSTDIDLNILVFPNPNNGTFSLTLNNEMKGNVTIKVADMLGKVVKEVKVNKNGQSLTTPFDMTDMNDGMYFIEVTDGNLVQKAKFVKGN